MKGLPPVLRQTTSASARAARVSRNLGDQLRHLVDVERGELHRLHLHAEPTCSSTASMNGCVGAISSSRRLR